MFQVSYGLLVLMISVIWILVRAIVYARQKRFNWRREIELLLVYICIIVVARFTFFPFFRVNGKIQPLGFDALTMFPLRINYVPLVSLFDYEIFREMLINVIGNTAMFIPIGVVWPVVYRKLDTHRKTIAAGVGFSLCIELLQLPFDRVTDIDDLILNSLGFLIGYGLYLLVKAIRK